MKLWWSLALVVAAVLMIARSSAAIEHPDLFEEDDTEVLVRTVRDAKERASGSQCRYEKGQWTECDPKTNTRSRTLKLKKGDGTCEQTKTISKNCKKACRYEKGTWSGCVNQFMSRIDNLKPNSDPSCEKTRRLSKRCKPESSSKKSSKGERGNKKSGKQ